MYYFVHLIDFRVFVSILYKYVLFSSISKFSHGSVFVSSCTIVYYFVHLIDFRLGLCFYYVLFDRYPRACVWVLFFVSIQVHVLCLKEFRKSVLKFNSKNILSETDSVNIDLNSGRQRETDKYTHMYTRKGKQRMYTHRCTQTHTPVHTFEHTYTHTYIYKYDLPAASPT